MGYRSELTVVIYGNGRNLEQYEALKVFMNTTFVSVYKEWESTVEWNDRGVLIFRIEDVKWYDSYSDVKEFNAMLDVLANELEYNYEMIRLGEEDDDTERTTGGDNVEWMLNVGRSVNVDI